MSAAALKNMFQTLIYFFFHDSMISYFKWVSFYIHEEGKRHGFSTIAFHC